MRLSKPDKKKETAPANHQVAGAVIMSLTNTNRQCPFRLSEHTELSVDNKEAVGQEKGDATYDDTHFGHLRSLHQSRGVGNGIGRGGDGQ